MKFILILLCFASFACDLLSLLFDPTSSRQEIQVSKVEKFIAKRGINLQLFKQPPRCDAIGKVLNEKYLLVKCNRKFR